MQFSIKVQPLKITIIEHNIRKVESKGKDKQGRLGGSVVERLPSAQGMILESQDRVPAWRLLLSLPMSLPLFLS